MAERQSDNDLNIVYSSHGASKIQEYPDELDILPDILEWENISLPKQVKLLFFLDIGASQYQDDNIMAVLDGNCAFRKFLQHRDPTLIKNILKKRVRDLFDYHSNPIQHGTHSSVIELRKAAELLTFLGICKFLMIECRICHKKKEMAQKMLGLTRKELDETFFLHSENIRLDKICNELLPAHVQQIFQIFQTEKISGQYKMDVQLNQLEIVGGLKEALFFYMIRTLEFDNKFNFMYTNILAKLLDSLKNQLDDENEKDKISNMIEVLSTYPNETNLPGHCIVFCATSGRTGAQGEITTITDVFEKSLGYTLVVHKDPMESTIWESIEELDKVKYRYYDSLVLWFISHGDEKTITLQDIDMDRETIIDSFCKIDNFRIKPKIFFMASCQGADDMLVEDKDGTKVVADYLSMTEDRSKRNVYYDENTCLTLKAVHYKMDRIISYATLHKKLAFRLEKEPCGSIYVDRVCQQMAMHGGESITRVLEKVCNMIHQTLFQYDYGTTARYSKQGCSYESTFQKTFIVPRSRHQTPR